MARVALIPARGGSKRIPRKNVREFCGKPIIAYPITLALDSSGLFDRVFVSTDDDEIADIAKRYGAELPFLRDEKTATDHAGLLEVIVEFESMARDRDIVIDEICCILPTTPLLTLKTLTDAHEMFDRERFGTVYPIVRYSYPVQRAVLRDAATGRCSMLDASAYATRSQDLEPVYHDAGQFYWVRVEDGWASRPLITGNAGGLVISEMAAQDIDTDEDWAICELKYRALR